VHFLNLIGAFINGTLVLIYRLFALFQFFHAAIEFSPAFLQPFIFAAQFCAQAGDLTFGCL
jgi:hypothetical protein